MFPVAQLRSLPWESFTDTKGHRWHLVKLIVEQMHSSVILFNTLCCGIGLYACCHKTYELLVKGIGPIHLWSIVARIEYVINRS
jgi:hypothetical protein